MSKKYDSSQGRVYANPIELARKLSTASGEVREDLAISKGESIVPIIIFGLYATLSAVIIIAV